jgi:hypothetical protein
MQERAGCPSTSRILTHCPELFSAISTNPAWLGHGMNPDSRWEWKFKRLMEKVAIRPNEGSSAQSIHQ